jgi:hypothetical protein
MQNSEVLDQVSQHKYRLPKPNCVKCPDSYYDMMLKCWDEVPENRPTFEYLYHFFGSWTVYRQPVYRNPVHRHARLIDTTV